MAAQRRVRIGDAEELHSAIEVCAEELKAVGVLEVEADGRGPWIAAREVFTNSCEECVAVGVLLVDLTVSVEPTFERRCLLTKLRAYAP